MHRIGTGAAAGWLLRGFLALAVSVGLLGLAPVTAARADSVSDETRFVQLINQSRTAAGAGPLAVHQALVSIARSHSDEMAGAGSVFHRPDLSVGLPAGWTLVGENVGMGSGANADAMHQAFMNSPSHRSNILNGAFNTVGIGVRFGGDGTIFVTQELMQGPLDGTVAPQTFPVPPSETPAVAAPSTIPRRDWYFAEGYTGPGFSERLLVLNPSGTTASVTITYLLPGGATREQSISVGPRRRATVDVNQAVGPNKEVSAVVRSDSPVVAQRVLDFLYQGRWDGQSALVGSPAPATSFLFAEGYTGPNFDEYLTLANPQSSDTTARVTYLFGDGTTQETSLLLGAHSRTTVDVRKVVGSNREVAVKVATDLGIMVERPMYFSYDGIWSGGHISAGMTAPATHLTFAEGYTGAGFVEYLTLLNPGDAAAHVSLTYLLGGGGTASQSVTVGSHARSTIRVNDVVPGRDVSVDLTSDQPIVAERPMYFAYKGDVSGGHDVVGSVVPARYWLFPGGDTTEGVDSYLTVGNAQPNPVAYTVTFYDDQGLTTVRNFSVPARARQTLNLAVEGGSGRRLGLMVAAASPLVMEQPSYTRTGTNGGSDVLGFSF